MKKAYKKKIYHYHGRGNTKTKQPPMWVKANPKLLQAYHPDEAWIKGIIRGHGGGNKKKWLVLWYNTKLFFKWLKRRLTGVKSPFRR